jgi:quercetin dioxygenase-like cupin family protein
MTEVRRYLVDRDASGLSTVVNDAITNSQSKEGYFWRSTLWATTRFPPDNIADQDVSSEVIVREPGASGIIFRALEIAPDDADAERHREVMAKLHDEVEQHHAPTGQELERHPGMHRTDTLDFITCVSGEIHLITDTDEVVMRPGDTAIMRGGNHAWSNQSSEPCLLTVVLVHARVD